MSDFAPLHFLNGKPLEKEGAQTLATSSAFLWGHSTFTTSYIFAGKWSFGQKHLLRLSENGDDVFGKKLPEEYILNGLKEIFNQGRFSHQENYSLRITVFENQKRNLCFLMSLAPFSRTAEHPWEKIDSFSYDHHSDFKARNIKAGNYSDSLLNHKTLLKPFIYLDSNENFSEGPICNFILFNEKEQIWMTPKNEGKVLEGIGLRFGMEGFGIKEREISFSEKDDFSAMFALNALRGPCPVDVWDNRALSRTREFEEKVKDAFKANEEKWSIEL